MNKEEFLSNIKDPDKFTLKLQTLTLDHLYEFTNLVYDSTKHKDKDPFGDTLITFDMLYYAINMYLGILDKSANQALEHARAERKFQMENK